VPAGVNAIELPTRHTYTSLGPLVRYLRRSRPDGLIASKDRGNRVAIAAKRLSGLDLPVAVRFDTTISAALASKSMLQRWLRTAPMRQIYWQADVMIAVSEGVQADAARLTGLDPKQIEIINYPVVTDELHRLAREPVDHPWLAEPRESRAVPVLLGVGRLTEQKDFPTLLDAFARVRQSRQARLIIMGEGEQRPALEQQARTLGVADAVDLPGFYANPYPIMRTADQFVLSSRWEGSPIVLTEALALGTPAVATDCPSGPRETLAAGRVGPLIEMGDAAGLAGAIARTLDAPPPAATLRQAAEPFTGEASAQAHLRTLGLEFGG
jgi:glycosyltransferase involved in cell wall biosynthesis